MVVPLDGASCELNPKPKRSSLSLSEQRKGAPVDLERRQYYDNIIFYIVDNIEKMSLMTMMLSMTTSMKPPPKWREIHEQPREQEPQRTF
ncbi:hypothetical protein [Sutterella wadsworthensis]|uniref:hypothetical protein n=1 Tax=Sutterella wadsworthensis TaxID=40545 RepID=UPI003A95D321